MQKNTEIFIIDQKIFENRIEQSAGFNLVYYYLLKEENEEINIELGNNLKGIIEYSEKEIKKDSYNLLKNIISSTGVEAIEELCIVSPNKSLIDLAKIINIKTCYIQIGCKENRNSIPTISELVEEKKLTYKKNII